MTKSPDEMTKEERLEIYVKADCEQLNRIFVDLKLTNKKEVDELFTDIMTIYGFTKKAVNSYFIKQILKDITIFQKARSEQVSADECELLAEWNNEFIKKQRELFEGEIKKEIEEGGELDEAM